MKGIILAGGSGTRLHPMTVPTSKQLLPLYDKPMIYYPLSVLMLAGINEVLIISTPQDVPRFQELFGDGSHLGLDIHYTAQPSPDGLAQAFILGEDFIGDSTVCLMLGDNLLHGHGLPDILQRCSRLTEGARIFGYHVQHPEAYGVVEFDEDGTVIGLEEKPSNPKSNYAVPGIYFYDKQVVEIAKGLNPSDRGELEITDVNLTYLEQGQLSVELLGRGFAWLDTGTPDQLHHATNYIQAIQARQGIQVACLEEIAYDMGYINKVQLHQAGLRYHKSQYGKYILQRAEYSLATSKRR